LLAFFFLAGQGHPAEKTKITLAYSTTGPTAVRIMDGERDRGFDKYGADPNLIFISSSPVVVPALISGDTCWAVSRGQRRDHPAVLGEIKMRFGSAPYLSKAPISFAIHNPTAVGPVVEYARVILVFSAG